MSQWQARQLGLDTLDQNGSINSMHATHVNIGRVNKRFLLIFNHSRFKTVAPPIVWDLFVVHRAFYVLHMRIVFKTVDRCQCHTSACMIKILDHFVNSSEDWLICFFRDNAWVTRLIRINWIFWQAAVGGRLVRFRFSVGNIDFFIWTFFIAE